MEEPGSLLLGGSVLPSLMMKVGRGTLFELSASSEAVIRRLVLRPATYEGEYVGGNIRE